jgi:hypothetical protein
MKSVAVISQLLLPAFLFLSAACNKRAEHQSGTPSTPSTPISDQERLKNELIASLRADLALLRSAKKSSQNGIYSLAQTLDQLMRIDPSTPSYGGVGTWNTEVQAHGSQKSADLAADYLRRLQAAQAEVQKAFDQRAEEAAKQITVKMFAAKTAGELDAPLLEISTLQGQITARGDTNSTSRKGIKPDPRRGRIHREYPRCPFRPGNERSQKFSRVPEPHREPGDQRTWCSPLPPSRLCA